jgi:hypothetical protein
MCTDTPPHPIPTPRTNRRSKGRTARHHHGELGSNPLRSMMEVLLWNNPQHMRMRQAIKEW